MQDRQLIVIYDALCCWTYGALPLLESLTDHCLAKREKLKLLPYGCSTCTDELFLTSQKANQCWNNCKLVENLSGQSFSEQYRTDILEAPGKQLDPTWILQAYTLLADNDLVDHLHFAQTLLQARYLYAKDTTQREVVEEVLQTIGIPESLIDQLGSEAAIKEADHLREQTETLLVEADNRGLPSFLLWTPETTLKMDHHPFLKRPEKFIEFIDKTVEAMALHTPPSID